MKTFWILSGVLLAALVIVAAVFLGHEPQRTPGAQSLTATKPAVDPIRIGLIPERDIFALRKRNRLLTDYLAEQLKRPVILVTASSYESILKDFAEREVDAAFLGSLVAVLTMDRLDGKVVARTQLPSGENTYTGVICVPETSPIRSIDDLAGKSVAMVRTTAAGHLFPVCEWQRHGLLEGAKSVRMVWAGTHDDAIGALIEGKVDAAAVKNLRLKAWLDANPGKRMRILAESRPVPENALVVRADIADGVGAQLAATLLDMDQSEKGRAVLKEYGAAKFVSCSAADYLPIQDMAAQLGSDWSLLGTNGPAPRSLAETDR